MDWMVDFGLSDTVTFPPTILDGAEWVIEAHYLAEQIECNSWTKKGFAWFTDGEEVEARDRGVHIGGDNVFFNGDANIDSNVGLCLLLGFEGMSWNKIISIFWIRLL